MTQYTDHELDHLFAQASDDLKITPSDEAWTTIEDQLSSADTRRMPSWLMMAASIILIASAGAWWLVQVQRPAYSVETVEVQATDHAYNEALMSWIHLEIAE